MKTPLAINLLKNAIKELEKITNPHLTPLSNSMISERFDDYKAAIEILEGCDHEFEHVEGDECSSFDTSVCAKCDEREIQKREENGAKSKHYHEKDRNK